MKKKMKKHLEHFQHRTSSLLITMIETEEAEEEKDLTEAEELELTMNMKKKINEQIFLVYLSYSSILFKFDIIINLL
jgi:hypothetical protein